MVENFAFPPGFRPAMTRELARHKPYSTGYRSAWRKSPWIKIGDHRKRQWSANPDLIRKNYLFDAENGVGDGVYL